MATKRIGNINVSYTVPEEQTQLYNMLGRDSGLQGTTQNNPDFFQKKWNSLENSIGTTLAAPASLIYDNLHRNQTDTMVADNQNKLDEIAKRYGFADRSAAFDAMAEGNGDPNVLSKMTEELKTATASAANEMDKRAKDYEDYRTNNYISQKINQDPGKFLGSAINTESTLFDVLSMAAGIPNGALINGAQGALEGVADELEQNGFSNFDLNRAAQNAAVGGVSGLATGALNSKINSNLLKNGGNLYKGNNVVSKALNNFNQNNKAGKILSTLGSGVARGAQSGLVGGAVGGGLSSALNGVELGQGVSNAIQSAVQGAAQGAVTGGAMAGANMVANAALNKYAPTIANKVKENQLRNAKYGDTMRDQFKGAWNSGDSAVAEGIKNIPTNLRNLANKLDNTPISNIGNSIRDVSGDQYSNFVSDPKVRQSLLANIEAAKAENPNARVGDTQVDMDALISEYSDKLTPDQYKNFNPTEAENALVNELQRLETENGFDTERQVATAQNTTSPVSQWDKLAQESGYATYDDVIKAFTQANPNAEVNAGSVLTWLDNNPGDWNPNMPVQAAGTETETKVKLPEVLTGKQIKGKIQIVDEIEKQFWPVDKPTSRSAKPSETFYNLYEDWGLSDGDDIRQAIAYAEPGSLIPQMIREAAGEAGIVDLTDADGMIRDLGINKKNYTKYVNALEDIMDSTETTIVGGKKGVDALTLQRALEQAASDAEGSNGTYHIGDTLVDSTMAKNFKRIANEVGTRLDEAAVSRGAVTKVLNKYAGDIQQMRDAFSDNPKWQNQIDTKVKGATKISDLRSSIRDLTRANIYITNGDELANTIGTRTATKQNNIPTTSASLRNKAANWAFNKLSESKPARDTRLSIDEAMVKGTNTTTPATTNSTPILNTNPANQIFNMIGRSAGLSNAEQARTANYLVDAVQEAEVVPNAPNAGEVTLESMVNPTTNTSTTSVYNSVYGTPSTNTYSQSKTGYFQPTGDYWTDILASALSSAIDDNDVEAFASLYEMYQDALSKVQSNSTTGQKLTATQQRANAAMNSLDRLETMTPDLAYNLSGIPVIGGIATFGGNDYEAEAKSLAQQIGYMVSGSNIKDSEAEAIGKSYVPQPWDNEAVRQNKLRRAREIITQYQNNYSE